ncbi:hypothetical protein I4U23_012474 [Adineta vaga]|nr:hypothetical protein I4U23_012474 [Adineta vaga]
MTLMKENSMMMKLELLPDELLLDLFDYFAGIDLLYAFSGLNFRFNYLLHKLYRNYRFILSSVSKRHFDNLCHQHLPLIADRIIHIGISNYQETPEQIDLFLSYISSFTQFTQLRILSFSYVYSQKICFKLLEEIHNLVNLIDLKIHSCSFDIDQNGFQIILDSIWSLPKLVYLRFDKIKNEQHTSFTPTKISLTLKYIIIYGWFFNISEWNHLLEYTPHLKHLSIPFGTLVDENHFESIGSTLTHLNIRVYEGSENLLVKTFQTVPHLYRLEIKLNFNLMNGHQWERIIRKYLPNIKVFRLIMNDNISTFDHTEDYVDKLVDTFRSPFWCEEHRWFIRCLIWQSRIQLHTLPNTFNYYEQRIPDLQKSTDPYDNKQDFYLKLTHIYDETYFDKMAIPYSSVLPHLEDLNIKLPINNLFWSTVPTLKRLRSLTIASHCDIFQKQVQRLLDQASHLTILCIKQDVGLPLQRSLFTYTNTTVEDLDLESTNHNFNEEDCQALRQSPLGLQCQVLTICVENRESILILVNHMKNLRSLKVQVRNEREKKLESSDVTNNHELILWLKDHLSSTYMITKHEDVLDFILIWI